MKFWFDTEFIDNGHTINMISIGIIAEDGRTYYAENSDCDCDAACPWVQEHVLSKLSGNAIPKAQIAQDLIEFFGDDPEIWGYYCSYDWVILCQLYGRMIDVPRTWPHFPMDVKQLCMMRGNPYLPEQPEDSAHNALADAVWIKEAWEFLEL